MTNGEVFNSSELPSACKTIKRKKTRNAKEMLTAVDEGLKIARNSHKLHLKTSWIIDKKGDVF